MWPCMEEGGSTTSGGRRQLLRLYKGSRTKNEWRRMSLLSVPGKVYGRVSAERLMEVMEGKVDESREGSVKGKAAWIRYLQSKWQWRNIWGSAK